MSATVSDIDACTKRLDVAVPRQEVDKEMKQAFSRLARRVRLKGFRKGRVPHHILERYYGEEIRAEVLNRVISDNYRRLLEERGMRPVGEPSVTDIEMPEGAPELTFKATVEVIPPFELGEYKGIEVAINRREVTEALLDEEVAKVVRASATLEEVERPAKAGDYVMFDIEGFEAGEPVAGTKGESQTFILGESEAEPELEAALTGVKPGEEKEVEIKVPAGAAPEIAGKTLLFRIACRSVKEARPPELNEDFVRSLGRGFSTVGELRAHIKGELESFEDSAGRSQGIAEILRTLRESHPFEVPQTLIRSQAEDQFGEYERRMREQNPENAISEAERKRILEELAPDAEARVREMILVDRIREKEGIQATSEEVEFSIRNLAARYQMEPEKLKERMSVTGGLDSLIRNINYNKATEWLYDQAKVEVKIGEPSREEDSSGEPEAGEK
ncbi:MAG: trigger factor [bacterium]